MNARLDLNGLFSPKGGYSVGIKLPKKQHALCTAAHWNWMTREETRRQMLLVSPLVRHFHCLIISNNLLY
jgi:hypothetical protein